MPDFGFCADAYAVRSIYQNDQECINWYPEVDQRKQPGERGYISLYPSPGMVSVSQLNVDEVRQLYTVKNGNIAIAVCGSNVYTISRDFVSSLIGTVKSNSGFISVTDNGSYVYIVDGFARYTYNLTTGVYATVDTADGPFQGGGTVDIVDNVIIYNQPNTRNWAGSDVNSVSTNQLSQGQKLSSPDPIVSLIPNQRQIYILGRENSEVWINAGAFPFTFQIIQSTTMQHGCAAVGSVARLGDTFALLSQDPKGTNIVVQVSGYEMNRISTFAVESDLNGQVVQDCRAFTYQIFGHEFYVMVFPTANKTWVYDGATKMWHKWLDIDQFGNYKRIRANCACSFAGQILVGDYQNGKIYKLDSNTYTNDGDTIKRLRRAPHLTNGLKRVFYSDLQIQFQPGVGLQSGQGSDPQAILRFSDDGGSTFSREYWRSIGRVGMYAWRCRWTQLGRARDRIFEVVVTDPVNVVIISAELNSEVADH